MTEATTRHFPLRYLFAAHPQAMGKVLGASYAIFKSLGTRWQQGFDATFDIASIYDCSLLNTLGKLTCCAATDGNHGQAVAWMSNILGMQAIIYVPSYNAKSRIDSILPAQAEVAVIDGEYVDTMTRGSKAATEKGWIAIGDRAYGS